MTIQRVALVLTFDVDGDPPDAINWAEHAVRLRFGGERLGLPAVLPLAPGFHDCGITVTAVGINSLRGAFQAGELVVEPAPARYRTEGS